MWYARLAPHVKPFVQGNKIDKNDARAIVIAERLLPRNCGGVFEGKCGG